MRVFDPSLYLIVDSLGKDCAILEQVREAVSGGVTLVQLREKSESLSKKKELGLALKKILCPKKIPLLVNDDIELAQSLKADGVHLGQKDCSSTRARELLGKEALIGLSIETLSQLKTAPLGSVDYVGVGPIFSTASKTDATFPLGISGLLEIRRQCYLPLVAIGGITLENAQEVLATGVDGLAVLSSLCHAPNPQRVAHCFRSLPSRKTPAKNIFRTLTIAGSDSGGGAGIQADLKTFQSLNCFGMSAITAITAQNTLGVREVFPLSPSLIQSQVTAVLEDIGADAVKIGMLFSSEIVKAIGDVLKSWSHLPLVLDPVAMAKGGSPLLQPSAIADLKNRLLPLAHLLTPNLPETEMLTGRKIDSKTDVEKAARDLLESCSAVLIKGGHSDCRESVEDYYADKSRDSFWLSYPRITTRNTHGTGCTYASAITAFLARGLQRPAAVRAARNYLQGAIAENSQKEIGRGHGPVDHSWLWKEVTA